MSINEANIIDVEDANILENTPMMVVEQDGKTIAVPIMGGGGGSKVQSDWNQTDDTAADYIKNKPEIAPGMALQNVITDDTSTEAVISNMAANTRYVFTKALTSLTIEAVEDSNFESEVQFRSGNTINVTFPSSLKFIGDDSVYPYRNYIINIKNKIAVVGYYE